MVCGKYKKFKSFTELCYHISQHLRNKIWCCDICEVWFEEGVEIGDIVPGSDENKDGSKKKGKKRRLNPFFLDFEKLCRHIRKNHTDEDVKPSKLVLDLKNSNLQSERDRYEKLAKGRAVPYTHKLTSFNEVEITYDFVQITTNKIANNNKFDRKPYHLLRVLDCRPANATCPEEVTSYQAEWSTIDEDTNELETTWEPVKQIDTVKIDGEYEQEEVDSDFMARGGSFSVKTFWELRDSSVFFDHESLHYTETDWFKYGKKE